MAALLIAFLIGAILVFWNVHSFVESRKKAPAFRDILCLNIKESDKRAFSFMFFVFVSFLVYGVISLFVASESVVYGIKQNFSDILLIVFFVSMLVNYLIRVIVMGGCSQNKDPKYMWDAWKVGAKNCKGEGDARALRYSNMVSLYSFVVFCCH